MQKESSYLKCRRILLSMAGSDRSANRKLAYSNEKMSTPDDNAEEQWPYQIQISGTTLDDSAIQVKD